MTGRGLAGGGGLGAIDLFLALEVLGSHVLGLHVAGIAGGDVHRDVFEQFLKVGSAGHKVALAVELDQHSDFAAGVNIGAYRALVGSAGGFLLRRGHAALAQHHERLFDVAFRLLQSLEAIAHGRAGLLTQLFHQLGINFFAHCRHLTIFLAASGLANESRLKIAIYVRAGDFPA